MDLARHPSSGGRGYRGNAVTRLAGLSLVALLAFPLDASPDMPAQRAPRLHLQPATLLPSTPEEQGMDSTLLAQAIDYLGSQRQLYNIHSLSVVRHGRLVADVSFWPSQAGQLHHIASITKVVTSAIIGIAIDKGYIAGVHERVLGFFPSRSIAASVSGHTNVMDATPLDILTATLTFAPSDETRVRVTSSGYWTYDDDFLWAAGLDSIERYAPGRFDIPAAGTGEWLDQSTFRMNVDELGNLALRRLTFVFQDGCKWVSITMAHPYPWNPFPTLVLTGRMQS